MTDRRHGLTPMEELLRRISNLERNQKQLKSSALVRIADHSHIEGDVIADVDPVGNPVDENGEPIVDPEELPPVELILTTGANENRIYIDAEWTPLNGASGYEVELRVMSSAELVSGDPEGDESEFTTVQLPLRRDYTLLTKHRFEPVEPFTWYEVIVYAQGSRLSGSVQYVKGIIQSGKDETVPEDVTGLSVTSGITSATAVWNEVPDEDVRNGNGQYIIQVSLDSNFTVILKEQNVGGSITSFTGLDSVEHFFRVKARDRSGNVSENWSDVVSTTPGAFDPVPTDGDPPASSPTPTITSGIGFLHAAWTGVANADPVTYEVYVSTTDNFTPNSGTKHGTVQGTSYFIMKTVGGNNLVPGTTYYVKIIATDADGAAAPSAQGSGSPTGNPLFSIPDFSVTEQKLADAAVAFGKLKPGVTASIAADTAFLNALVVRSAQIEDGTILSADIGNAQIITAKIADLNVTTGKIALLAVGTAQIADLAVTNAKIANLAVGTAQIQDAAIATAKIADLAVQTAKIADLNVTTGKIANLAVTNAKIGNLAVDTAQIANAAVTTLKVGDAQITSAKIVSLEANKLTTDTLTSTVITLGTGGIFRAGRSTSPFHYFLQDANGIRFYRNGSAAFTGGTLALDANVNTGDLTLIGGTISAATIQGGEFIQESITGVGVFKIDTSGGFQRYSFNGTVVGFAGPSRSSLTAPITPGALTMAHKPFATNNYYYNIPDSISLLDRNVHITAQDTITLKAGAVPVLEVSGADGIYNVQIFNNFAVNGKAEIYTSSEAMRFVGTGVSSFIAFFRSGTGPGRTGYIGHGASSDDRMVMQSGEGSIFLTSTTNSNTYGLNVSPNLVYNTTVTSVPNLWMSSSGWMYRTTHVNSSLRHKTVLAPFSLDDAAALLDLEPFVYTRTDVTWGPNRPQVGVAAEDVAAIDRRFVEYELDEDGDETNQVDKVHYDRMVPALLTLVRDLRERVRELEVTLADVT